MASHPRSTQEEQEVKRNSIIGGRCSRPLGAIGSRVVALDSMVSASILDNGHIMGFTIQSKFPPYGSVTLSIAPIYILAVE